MKPDQIPGANQDAGGIPVYPGEAPRNLAAPEGLSLDVLKAALKADQTIRSLTMRLGTFNEAWWDRFASELLAGLSPSSGESGSPGEDR